MGNLKLDETIVQELRQRKASLSTHIYLPIEDTALVSNLFSLKSNTIRVGCAFESVIDIYGRLTN